MNKTKFLAFFLLFAFLLAVPLSADGAINYYCMRKKNHERPSLEPQMAFLTEHGGVYLGKDEKVLYLTFDAGYENGNIARILDVLAKHHATGAFFVLDHLVRSNTDLVCRMADEGHLVCNHTAHHKNMTTLSDEEFQKELAALETLYREKTGKELARFYRPPEGKFCERNLVCAESLGYTTVFWSLAYADWDNQKQPAPDYAKKLLFDNTHNGAVILLHPTSKTNADILDELLTEWEAQGYRFGSLTELVGANG